MVARERQTRFLPWYIPSNARGTDKVSKKYMPPYVAEFSFRYNNRENADIFGAAIAGC